MPPRWVENLGRLIGQGPAERYSLPSERAARASRIRRVFGKWLPETDTDLVLGLLDYVDRRPHRFFDHPCFEEALAFFNAEPAFTVESMSEEAIAKSLTKAFQTIWNQGSSWTLEDRLSLDDPVDFVEFEQVWHPEYQRYAEHVFGQLITLPLRVLERKKPGKNYVGDKLGKQINLLKVRSLAKVAESCSTLIRNAISHGSVEFGHGDVTYTSEDKPPLVCTAEEFAARFDALVDACHGVAAAVLVFLAQREASEGAVDLAGVPLGVLEPVVRGAVGVEGLTVERLIESKVSGGVPQLNVYCKTTSLHRGLHARGASRAATECQRLTGDRFTRIGVLINCGEGAHASQFFDAKVLTQGRLEGLDPKGSPQNT